jgi:hypothetical protein
MTPKSEHVGGALVFELTETNALDDYLWTAPRDRHFGDGNELKKGRVKLRLGEVPSARKLRDVNAVLGKPVPEEFQAFDAYEIWLLTFGVGILAEGVREVDRFGLEIELPERPRMTVLSLMPSTRFIKKFEAGWEFSSSLKLNGSLAVPDYIEQVLQKVEFVKAGGSIEGTAKAGVLGNVKINVMTPVVQTVGVGGREFAWVLEKDESPLVGDQVLTAVVLTPQQLPTLNVRARLSATVSVFDLLPSRLETDWVGLAIPLEGAGSASKADAV